MDKRVIINGSNIHDITSFYKEINHVFMSNEDWEIAPSLDALSDLFYGGFGQIKGSEKIQLVWTCFEQNKKDLGMEATKEFYQNKLKSRSHFNIDFAQRKLDELEKGIGQTYFEIILEIISEHPNIELIPQ